MSMRSDCAIVPPFPPCEGLRCGGCPACTRIVHVNDGVSGDDREPSCTGCGAVAVADGRCNYCRERFGDDSDAILGRLVLAVAAVAKRLPHVIEGDPAGYHAGLVEAFDGLMVALQGVPAPGERTP